MPNDIIVHDLTREQISHLDKVLDVFGEPAIAADVPPIIVVLQAAQAWYGKKQQALRTEERSGG